MIFFFFALFPRIPLHPRVFYRSPSEISLEATDCRSALLRVDQSSLLRVCSLSTSPGCDVGRMLVTHSVRAQLLTSSVLPDVDCARSVTSPLRQQQQRISRRAVAANLEIAHRRALWAGTHRGDALAHRLCIAFLHAHRLRVSVCAQVSVAVFDDQQLSVAQEAGAEIHDAPVTCGAHFLAQLAGDRQTMAAAWA